MAALNIGSDTQQCIVRLDRFSYTYPGAADCTLRDVSLTIEPGECHLLEGPTGSGKTTLLMAIQGLLPVSHQSGVIELASSTASFSTKGPGLIQQNPKAQLLCTHLGAEIAFGLENHCVDPSVMPCLVEQALETVGLNRPLGFPVDSLSMGQQYRACIAGQLVMEPMLLMLDEPVAQLDPSGREKTLEIIRQIKRSGRAVLICEHRPDCLQSVVDHFWRLDGDGRLTEIKKSLPAKSRVFSCSGPKSRDIGVIDTKTDVAAPAIIRVEGVRFADSHGAIEPVALNFSVHKGECLALCGPNGSGKTTLIRAIAGLIKPPAGTVEVFDTSAELRSLRGRIAVLFQDPGKQLFETTVFEEVAFAAHRIMAAEENVREWVTFLLDELGLSDLAEISPHTLSYGQKHLVGLAAVLAGKPEILLLDDHFAGLDSDRTTLVMRLIAKVSAEQGTTVVWTTHDPGSIAGWAHRVIDISGNQAPGTKETMSDASPEDENSFPASNRKLSMPTGLMLSLSMALSMMAFAARTSELLLGLTGVNLLILLLLSKAPFQLLKKSCILLFWQGALIVLLYGIRFGFAEGALSGGRVAWQLFLAFWPGMIFMSANSQPRIVRTLSKVLPQRTAFVSATCLRFLPMLLTEMQQIREVQILRGAGIMVTDLKYPRYWPDWFFCLLIPTLIKTLALADDIATAALARDFGLHEKRTAWAGD